MSEGFVNEELLKWNAAIQMKLVRKMREVVAGVADIWNMAIKCDFEKKA